MEKSIIFAIEIIGTIAFASSGAMLGIRKNLDIFGVVVLGLCVAVGGGIVRDIILGLTPPSAFRDPSYALTALVTAVLLFGIVYWKQEILTSRYMEIYETIMNYCDAAGLGIFTVLGVYTGYEQGYRGRFFLIFLGMLTGIGGGVIRDVLADTMPFILRKHIYAVASLAGAFCLSAAYRTESLSGAGGGNGGGAGHPDSGQSLPVEPATAAAWGKIRLLLYHKECYDSARKNKKE